MGRPDEKSPDKHPSKSLSDVQKQQTKASSDKASESGASETARLAEKLSQSSQIADIPGPAKQEGQPVKGLPNVTFKDSQQDLAKASVTAVERSPFVMTPGERARIGIEETTDTVTGATYKFDQKGRIINVADKSGRQTKINYDDASGNPKSFAITNASGMLLASGNASDNNSIAVNQQSAKISSTQFDRHHRANGVINYLPDGSAASVHLGADGKPLHVETFSLERPNQKYHLTYAYLNEKGRPAIGDSSTKQIVCYTADGQKQKVENYVFNSETDAKNWNPLAHEQASLGQNASGQFVQKHDLQYYDGLGQAHFAFHTEKTTDNKTFDTTAITKFGNGSQETVRFNKAGAATHFTRSENGREISAQLKDGKITGAHLADHNKLSGQEFKEFKADAEKAIARVAPRLEAAAKPESPEQKKLREEFAAFAKASGMNGLFYSADGKESYRLDEGKLKNNDHNVIAQIDQHNKVTFIEEKKIDNDKEETRPKKVVDINSCLNHLTFQGYENGKVRVFQTAPEFSNGSIFLPQNGKSVEYEVRSNMLIDKTGQQYGWIYPPNTESGHLAGGGIQKFGERKITPLADAQFAGASFSLKLQGEGGIKSREYKGVVLGAPQKVAAKKDGSPAPPGASGILDLQEVKDLESRRLNIAKEELAIAQNPINFLMNTSKSAEAKLDFTIAKINAENANGLISRLQGGVADLEAAWYLQDLAAKAQEKLGQSGQEKIVGEPPALTKDNVFKAHGTLRIDDEVYGIREGHLIRTTGGAGDKHAEEDAGMLGPNYTVQFKDGRSLELARQNRVLLSISVDDRKPVNVLGLGHARVAKNGDYFTGGLVAVKSLAEQPKQSHEDIVKGYEEHLKKRGLWSGGLANLMDGDAEGKMATQEKSAYENVMSINSKLNHLFTNGFKKDSFYPDAIDKDVEAVELMLKANNVKAITAEQLRGQAAATQEAVKSGLILGGSTVLTGALTGLSDGIALPAFLANATKLAAVAKTMTMLGMTEAKAVAATAAVAKTMTTMGITEADAVAASTAAARTMIGMTSAVGATAAVTTIGRSEAGESWNDKAVHAGSGALTGLAMGIPGMKGVDTAGKLVLATAGYSAQAGLFTLSEAYLKNQGDMGKAIQAMSGQEVGMGTFAGLAAHGAGTVVSPFLKRLVPDVEQTLAKYAGKDFSALGPAEQKEVRILAAKKLVAEYMTATGDAVANAGTYGAVSGIPTAVEQQREALSVKHNGKISNEDLWQNLRWDELVGTIGESSFTAMLTAGASAPMGHAAGRLTGHLITKYRERPAEGGGAASDRVEEGVKQPSEIGQRELSPENNKYSFEVLQRQLQDANVAGENIRSICTEKNLLGDGGKWLVYNMPGAPDFVLRIRKGFEKGTAPLGQIEPHAPMPGINVGQPVAAETSKFPPKYLILKRQEGEPLGFRDEHYLGRKEDDFDSKLIAARKLVAEMPQASFDRMAGHIKQVNEHGYMWDSLNSLNLLVDKKTQQFNLIDTDKSNDVSNHYRRQGAHDMMNALLDTNLVCKVIDQNNVREYNKEIIAKVVHGCVESGIPIDVYKLEPQLKTANVSIEDLDPIIAKAEKETGKTAVVDRQLLTLAERKERVTGDPTPRIELSKLLEISKNPQGERLALADDELHGVQPVDKYRQNMKSVAEMPQDAYNKMAKDLMLLGSLGHYWNSRQSDNVFFDAKSNQFNLANIRETGGQAVGSYDLSDMVGALCDPKDGKQFGSHEDIADYQRQIIEKCLQTCEATSLPVTRRTNETTTSFNNPGVFDAWELAGLPESDFYKRVDELEAKQSAQKVSRTVGAADQRSVENAVVKGDNNLDKRQGDVQASRAFTESENRRDATSLPNTRIEYQHADYGAERAKFSNLIAAAFDGSPDYSHSRLLRVEGLQKEFEKNAEMRGVTKDQKALFYLQLNRLIGSESDIKLSRGHRVNLAEQVLNHAAMPATVDQGRNSTCNVSVLENRLYAREPEAVARMVADAGLHGSYVTSAGDKIDMRSLAAGLDPDWEAENNLKLQKKDALQDDLSGVKQDGSRDWASQIVQTAMANIRWHNDSQYVSAGNECIWDKRVRLNLSGQLVQVGKTGQQTVLHDSSQRPLQRELYPGESAYDKDGKLVVSRTKPGDIVYDKIGDAGESGECVFHKGQRLKESDGELIDSPAISVSSWLPIIETAITGKTSQPFIIENGNRGQNQNSLLVHSPEELVSHVAKLKAANNLPAVLIVHTGNSLDENGARSVYAAGKGGWHVINIYDCDEHTKKISGTDQHGSEYDFMEGVPAHHLYNATMDPEDYTPVGVPHESSGMPGTVNAERRLPYEGAAEPTRITQEAASEREGTAVLDRPSAPDSDTTVPKLRDDLAESFKRLHLPKPTGASMDLGAGVTQTPWLFGDIIHAADRSVTVTDQTIPSSRTYDGHGRLIKAKIAGNGQEYKYDKDDELVRVETSSPSERIVLERTGRAWLARTFDSAGKNVATAEDECYREVSPKGGLIVTDPMVGRSQHELLSGETEHYDSEGELFSTSNRDEALETKMLQERMMRLADSGSVNKFEKLRQQFEHKLAAFEDEHYDAAPAAEENHDIEVAKREHFGPVPADVYKQLNRVLTASSRSDLSGAKRKQIVEQVVGWCAHPETVDKENNPYNRFLKFSANDYELFPDKTVKEVADFVLNSNFTDSDGRLEVLLANGRREYLQANYDHEKAQFSDLIKTSFEGDSSVVRSRLVRIESLQKEFEKQADERGVTKDQVALVYRQLNRLIGEDSDVDMTRDQRASLAEQVLNHATMPATVDQGNNGTCNVSVEENRLYARAPEALAQMVADIGLHGKYVTAAGAVIDLKSLKIGVTPDAQAKASLEMQGYGHAWDMHDRSGIKFDGSRDWASQLVQTALVNIRWHNDLQYLSPDNQCILASHVRFNQLGELVQVDQNDQQTVLHDHAGNPLDRFLRDGESAFDKSGDKVLLTRTAPGEIVYDKIQNAGETGECVLYKGKQLKDANGSLIAKPSISTGEWLRFIESAVTGTKSEPFVIENANTGNSRDALHANSAEELVNHIVKLADSKNMPAVLVVHTGNKVFLEENGSKSILGQGIGGWHVINVYGYDKQTQRIKGTNQYGSEYDFMKDGVDPKSLYDATMAPKLVEAPQAPAAGRSRELSVDPHAKYLEALRKFASAEKRKRSTPDASGNSENKVRKISPDQASMVISDKPSKFDDDTKLPWMNRDVSELFERLHIPKPIDAPISLDNAVMQKWQFGNIIRSADGKLTVSDETVPSTRTFDSRGRLLEATAGNRSQTYLYDEHGDLARVETISPDARTVLDRVNDEWAMSRFNSDTGKYEEVERHHSYIEANPEGGVSITASRGRDFKHILVTGWSDSYHNNGQLKNTSTSDGTLETRTLQERLRRVGDNDDYNRLDTLRQQFEHKVASTESEAFSVYRQLNRVLADDSASNLSVRERKHIVEQLLVWCTDPETVGMDNSPYNRVLNLSREDYNRAPAETIKKFADLVLKEKIVSSNGSLEAHFSNGRIEYLQANHDHEKTLFSRLMDVAFDNPESHGQLRLQRVKGFQEEFEKNAQERGVTTDQIALVYRQLNRLVGETSRVGLTHAERADLAEQILSRAATATSDQGNNSTCNVSALEKRLYFREPESLARMVSDIALDGTYVTSSGDVIDARKLTAGIKPDAEAVMNLGMQRSEVSDKGALGDIKYDGLRDWAGQIAQTTMVNIRWHNDLQYLSPTKHLVIEERIHQIESGELVMEDASGRQIVLQDGDHQVLMRPLYPGESAFHDGDRVVTRTKPGQIVYDKIRNAGETGECVLYEGAQLKHPRGWLIHDPLFYSPDQFNTIERAMTGKTGQPFFIENGPFSNDLNTLFVNSPEELVKTIRDSAGNLPLLLKVHTGHKLFIPEKYGAESIFGNRGEGGWHVVTVHGVNDEDGILGTGQWGSKYDFDKNGYPAQFLYGATMQPSKDEQAN